MTASRLGLAPLVGSVATIAAAGAAGALTALLLPRTPWTLAVALPGHRPHPVLMGHPSEVADVLVTNLPPLLALLLAARAASSRRGFWRAPGELVAAVIALGTGFRIGAALALHGASLLPYLPHVPLELAAIAVTCSTWRAARNTRVRIGPALRAVLVLVLAAALIEVYATPHRKRPQEAAPTQPGVCPADRSQPSRHCLRLDLLFTHRREAGRSIFAPPSGMHTTAPRPRTGRATEQEVSTR